MRSKVFSERYTERYFLFIHFFIPKGIFCFSCRKFYFLKWIFQNLKKKWGENWIIFSCKCEIDTYLWMNSNHQPLKQQQSMFSKWVSEKEKQVSSLLYRDLGLLSRVNYSHTQWWSCRLSCTDTFIHIYTKHYFLFLMQWN